MRDRLREASLVVRSWFQPRRRAAVTASLKAAILIGCLWTTVWMWHTRYYSRRYPEMPLSLAWSLLTVIGGIIFAQAGCSAVLKLRGARLRKLNAETRTRLTAMLADYISTGTSEAELQRMAKASPRDFEICLTGALLGTRGYALDRLRELPGVTGLRDRWIIQSRKGVTLQRRHAVEHLALLQDPKAIMALEVALEDPNSGVVAAAVRGLLRIPVYADRDKLIRSIPQRPYLVQVLTAGEVTGEEPTRPALPAFPIRSTAPKELHELQMRAAVRPVRHRKLETTDADRATCSALAGLGQTGRDLLKLMSAAGLAGDAPAEALGERLAAAARGGRP